MQHLNARRANLDFLPATSGHNRDLDLDRPNEAAIWIIERILNLMSGYYERWILKQSFPFRYAPLPTIPIPAFFARSDRASFRVS